MNTCSNLGSKNHPRHQPDGPLGLVPATPDALEAPFDDLDNFIQHLQTRRVPNLHDSPLLNSFLRHQPRHLVDPVLRR